METIDQQILFLINGANTPFLDEMMSLISGKLTWLPLYLVILFVLYKHLGLTYKFLAALVTIGLTFFLTDFCCSQIIRPMFDRLRPVCVDNPIHTMVRAVDGYRQNKSYGFPSCHASNTYGLAMLSWLYLRIKWDTIAIFGWALTVCYSRVYLGVHYPGDVLFGAILGITIGICMFKLSMFLQNKYLKGKEPTKKQQPLIAFAVAATIICFAIISAFQS